MLSRVADSIYWLNRYVERAENVARFLEVNLNLSLDDPSGLSEQWRPLVTTTGDLKFYQSLYEDFSGERVINFLTFDRQYPNSIVSCVKAARDNARSIRDVISSTMWEQLNDFYLLVTESKPEASLSEVAEFLGSVKQSSHSFNGVMDATMSHNEGWHFGRMGRYMERADKTSRILDVKYFLLLPGKESIGTPIDELGWIALLKSASAYEMYRQSLCSSKHRITPAGVANFLILDSEFPRSIRFCLREAEFSLRQITGSSPGCWDYSCEQMLGRLQSKLAYQTIDEILQNGLHEFLDDLQHLMNAVDREIFETFFALPPIATHA